ncbi:RpiR family transcriptional regulator protein (plasmid) [Rhizobium etli 8C-3]|uniref:RpiR family transcriptional regulator protein n=2 Tax=Rhizobium TaxID=379 RepID=A0A1L5PHA2_RHIET|nr:MULTISPECIES: MurR/RpiR family transcriptional regulator [Rhizobium]APO79564.1 RpiR family transcriptional regulator protein [Rhizobium etli 8C-3]TCU31290.1 RpiR family transcriptional regulator [Rhizobium azibense]
MLKDRDRRPPETLQELKYLIAKRHIVFSNSVERVAKQIIERPEMIAFESAAAIARNCEVSQTTVHRLAHHIGFRTLREFRAMIRDHLRKTAENHR